MTQFVKSYYILVAFLALLAFPSECSAYRNFREGVAFSGAVSKGEDNLLAVGDSGKAPRIPTNFPSTDQNVLISGALLQDHLVTDALAIVNSVVPQNLLSIAPSTYIKDSNVKYNADASANCYWPSNQCIRKTDGTGYIKDVYTCLGTNQWGLSYDDGPTSNIVNGVNTADSLAIYNELQKLNVTATFFSVGSNVIQNQAVLKTIEAAGHQIGIHTWTHHPLTSLTNAQIVAEIKYTEAIIYQAIGKVPSYLRPPYGDVDDRVRAIANALGYHVAIWNQDSTDADVTTTTANRDTVYNIILSWFGLATSFVSLEHDINTFTSGIAVSALQQIQKLKAAGTPIKFNIMSVGQCNNHQLYTYPVVLNTTANATTVVTTTIKKTTTTSNVQTVTLEPSGKTAKSGSKQITVKGLETIVIVGVLVMFALC
ncbi:chitin deacetylase [Nowakowskiella sp. JEL0078]|nr:chitin deacetylase [Nowakowskiella sp. JEL0078]